MTAPESKQRVVEHSKELIKAFNPIRFILIVTGQMPFEIRKKKDNTYSFKLNVGSMSMVIFIIFFVLNTTIYFLFTFGIGTFIFSRICVWVKPTSLLIVKDTVITHLTEERLWESYLTRKEMVPIIVIWSWMTISFTGTVYIVLHGKFYTHYMNYFNRVVQLMDMDVTPGIRKYLWRHNLATMIVALILVIGYGLQPLQFNAVANTANVAANFIFRIFNIEIIKLSTPLHRTCELFGVFIIIYSFVRSRANILQFLFFAQLLKNGTKIWNERFTKVLETDQATLLAEDENSAGDHFSKRLELRNVTKDHLILLQLFQMTSTVFGNTLFVFYCFNVIAVVLEIYQLAALGGFEEDIEVDSDQTTETIVGVAEGRAYHYSVDPEAERDTLITAILILLLLSMNMWFAISTTDDAAAAYEQAMEGLQILRQHGFMYCRNATDRNFVWSMYFSFSKTNPMVLSASGYFAVNRALLVAMAGAIVNWSVSIYQTRIDQWESLL